MTLLMKHSHLYLARMITPASHWRRLDRPRTGDEVLLVWWEWEWWQNGEEAGEVIGSIDQPTQTRARASAAGFQKIVLVWLASQRLKIGLELIWCDVWTHKAILMNDKNDQVYKRTIKLNRAKLTSLLTFVHLMQCYRCRCFLFYLHILWNICHHTNTVEVNRHYFLDWKMPFQPLSDTVTFSHYELLVVEIFLLKKAFLCKLWQTFL